MIPLPHAILQLAHAIILLAHGIIHLADAIRHLYYGILRLADAILQLPRAILHLAYAVLPSEPAYKAGLRLPRADELSAGETRYQARGQCFPPALPPPEAPAIYLWPLPI